MSSDLKAVDVSPDPFGHWPDNPVASPDMDAEAMLDAIKNNAVPVSGLDVIQSQPACKRTGMCCETILLDLSPSQLRRDYQLWVNNSITYGQARFSDIHIIFPMLEGRCRGKWRNPTCGTTRYVYGPCKNLMHETVEKDGVQTKLAGCSIHDHRPALCRNYPYYRASRVVEMTASGVGQSPGYMQGCGYNADAEAGFAPKLFETLEPLTDSEK